MADGGENEAAALPVLACSGIVYRAILGKAWINKDQPLLIRGLQKQGCRHPSVGDLVHLRIFGGLPASARRQ